MLSSRECHYGPWMWWKKNQMEKNNVNRNRIFQVRRSRGSANFYFHYFTLRRVLFFELSQWTRRGTRHASMKLPNRFGAHRPFDHLWPLLVFFDCVFVFRFIFRIRNSYSSCVSCVFHGLRSDSGNLKRKTALSLSLSLSLPNDSGCYMRHAYEIK